MSRCPICRSVACADAKHARIREEIRAERALDLLIEAGENR